MKCFLIYTAKNLAQFFPRHFQSKMSRSKNTNAMDNHVERLFYYTDLLEETYRGFCHSELDARNKALMFSIDLRHFSSRLDSKAS